MMNERIQELAKQAEDHADSQGFFVTIDFASDYQDCLMEKFAELIVQKCVSIVALHGITNFENQDVSWACENIVKEIKEHFGVEE
jgi:hypothetical protein